MHDLKEFIAESREVAVQQASQHFGVSADELVVHDVKGDVSGLGPRVIVLAGVPGSAPPDDDGGRPRARGRDRDRDRDRGSDRRRGDRDRDRGRGDRGRGRDRDRDDRGRGGDRGRRGERGRGDDERRRDQESDEAPRERKAPLAASMAPPRELDQLGPVGNYVAGILQRLGAVEGVEFAEESTETEITVSAQGPGVTAVISSAPGVLGAIRHLAARAAKRHVDEDVRIRIELGDAEEEVELEPAEEELLANVRDLAREASEAGEPQETDPLSSRERWLVHNALREFDGVSSESTGEGDRKRVRILPD